MTTMTILNIVYLAIIAALVVRIVLLQNHMNRENFERRAAAADALLTEEYHVSRGPSELKRWFGLSYAAWAVLPRVAMQAMPDKWQAEMAKLLDELDDEFPKCPTVELDLSVRAKKDGKFVKIPETLTNYRHPKPHVLQSWRQGVKKT